MSNEHNTNINIANPSPQIDHENPNNAETADTASPPASSVKLRKQIGPKPDSKFPWQCSDCGQQYAYFDSAKSHFWKHHDPEKTNREPAITKLIDSALKRPQAKRSLKRRNERRRPRKPAGTEVSHDPSPNAESEDSSSSHISSRNTSTSVQPEAPATESSGLELTSMNHSNELLPYSMNDDFMPLSSTDSIFGTTPQEIFTGGSDLMIARPNGYGITGLGDNVDQQLSIEPDDHSYIDSILADQIPRSLQYALPESTPNQYDMSGYRDLSLSNGTYGHENPFFVNEHQWAAEQVLTSIPQTENSLPFENYHHENSLVSENYHQENSFVPEYYDQLDIENIMNPTDPYHNTYIHDQFQHPTWLPLPFPDSFYEPEHILAAVAPEASPDESETTPAQENVQQIGKQQDQLRTSDNSRQNATVQENAKPVEQEEDQRESSGDDHQNTTAKETAPPVEQEPDQRKTPKHDRQTSNVPLSPGKAKSISKPRADNGLAPYFHEGHFYRLHGSHREQWDVCDSRWFSAPS